MNHRLDRNKNIEMLLERLIMMVAKSNERYEHLHQRILQLEHLYLDQSKKQYEKRPPLS